MFNRKKILTKGSKVDIGNKYYFSTTLSHLEQVVKEKNKDFCGTLNRVESGLFYMEDGSFGWNYLYPTN